VENLQKNTKMQMNNKTVIQKFIVGKITLIKSIRIFKGTPRVETLLVHQCSMPNIAWLVAFCSQLKLKK
jgi:hypothetical protein